MKGRSKAQGRHGLTDLCTLLSRRTNGPIQQALLRLVERLSSFHVLTGHRRKGKSRLAAQGGDTKRETADSTEVCQLKTVTREDDKVGALINSGQS